jgi:hypothetical protein
MVRIEREDDPRLEKHLHHLEHMNQLLCQIATAILPGNGTFEKVWSTTNQIYDRYHSTPVRFMSQTDFDASGSRALSA